MLWLRGKSRPGFEPLSGPQAESNPLFWGSRLFGHLFHLNKPG